MALIKCPECGREVSDRATACPHCGYPIAEIEANAKESIESDENLWCVVVPHSVSVSNRVYLTTELLTQGYISSDEKSRFVKAAQYPFLLKKGVSKESADAIAKILLKYHATVKVCMVSELDNDAEEDQQRTTDSTQSDMPSEDTPGGKKKDGDHDERSTPSASRATISQSTNKPKKKSKMGWIVFLALVCGVIAILVITSNNNIKKVKNKIIEVCESYNLSSVEVSLSKYNPQIDTDGYSFYKVNVSCAGFSALESERMYECFQKIEGADSAGEKIIFSDSNVTITSDGHSYKYDRGDSEYGWSGYVYCDGAKVFEKTYPKTSTSTGGSSSGTSGGSTYSVDSGARHTDAEAFTVAETIVEGYLKSPSTAKFCKVYEATITNSGDKYTVKGWVDAQNGFGATIRQNFTVTYTAIKKGNDIGYKNGSATFS